MDNAIQPNYSTNLSKLIEEQSKRFSELEFLFTSIENNFADKHNINRLQIKSKKLSFKAHKLKFIKYKQERLALIKLRTNTTKKLN